MATEELIEKQKLIREGLARRICGLSPDVIASPKTPDRLAYGLADRLLVFLHDKGAVLKVEREMPIPKDWIGDFNPGIFTEQVLIAAGFTATAPLTEKK